MTSYHGGLRDRWNRIALCTRRPRSARLVGTASQPDAHPTAETVRESTLQRLGRASLGRSVGLRPSERKPAPEEEAPFCQRMSLRVQPEGRRELVVKNRLALQAGFGSRPLGLHRNRAPANSSGSANNGIVGRKQTRFDSTSDPLPRSNYGCSDPIGPATMKQT
jgi:hypothetical protein